MNNETILFKRFEDQARENAKNAKDNAGRLTPGNLVRLDNFLKLTGSRGYIRATANDLIAAGIKIEAGSDFRFWYLDNYGNIVSI